jgi:hypothetical protein
MPAGSSFDVKRLCDDISRELVRMDCFLVDDTVSDEGAGIIAEIEILLERLYACPHGQGESLKRVIVAVQSQVNNAPWDKRHIDFLGDIVRFLRVRHLVDDAAVDACYDMIKARGLDPFRGTICWGECRRGPERPPGLRSSLGTATEKAGGVRE